MARHHYLAGGGAEVATNGSEVGAATLWDPPGRWKQAPFEELRMAPAFLLAFRSRMAGAQKIADIMKDKHPEEEDENDFNGFRSQINAADEVNRAPAEVRSGRRRRAVS